MTIQTGTVIHGTMRPEDLIPAFIAELPADEKRARFEKEWANISARPARLRDHRGRFKTATPYEIRDAEGWLLEELFDALNDIAPEGTYFGAHPGDGSDYGFWQSEETDHDCNFPYPCKGCNPDVTED